MAINSNDIKPIELSAKTGIDKSMISSYLSGRYKASDENMAKLASFLGVSEAWLDGYDVSPYTESYENKNNTQPDEFEILFNKNKDILTEDDKETIKFLIEKRKREIDKQLGED